MGSWDRGIVDGEMIRGGFVLGGVMVLRSVMIKERELFLLVR